jgi:hypothetical protein
MSIDGGEVRCDTGTEPSSSSSNGQPSEIHDCGSRPDDWDSTQHRCRIPNRTEPMSAITNVLSNCETTHPIDVALVSFTAKGDLLKSSIPSIGHLGRQAMLGRKSI